MRLLIATDGSPSSHIVKDEIAARPWPLGTEVLVLCCVDSATYPIAPSIVTLALKSAREELDDYVKALNECASLKVSTLVSEGHPARTIVTQAEAWGADFIFMGSHGLGPIGRFLLGSTVTAVLHQAPCAVEIVRHPRRIPESDRNGERRILLAADGSAGSDKAVESVLARPWPRGSEFRVVSVPVFGTPQMEPGFVDAVSWAEIRDNAIEEANRAAAQTLARFKGSGFAVDAVVPSGVEGPKASILDEAERWHADLIVVGAHGHGRLDRFLLGSISETLALYAPCSVEVFREKHVQLVKDDFRTEASYIPVAPAVSGGA